MGLFQSTSADVDLTLGPDNVSVPAWASQLKQKNPVVFFDINVGGNPLGQSYRAH